MSAGSHRNDYVILAVLALASVVVVALAVSMGWGRGGTGSPQHTTYSADDEGVKAYYLLLERIALPTRRLRDPFEADTLADVDVLFLLDAMVPLQPGESEALAAWIRSGGVLVCAQDTATQLSLFSEPPVEGYPSPSRWPPASDRVRRRRARWGEPAGREPAGAEPTEFGPSTAWALARDVKRTQFAGTDGHLSIFNAPDLPGIGPFTPLLGDTGGVRIAAWRLGKGNIILLGDGSFLSNDLLGKADNAVAAANLAEYALQPTGGRRVAFDEYHLGHSRTKSAVLGRMLLGTYPGAAVLCATAAGILYLLYRGRRLGTRRPPPPSHRRSKLEFVHAVGATYRAAGANKLTFGILYNAFRGRVTARVRLPENAKAEQLAARLAEQTGSPPEQYTHTLTRCEQALGASRLSGRALSGLLNEIAVMEWEVFHGDRGSQ